MSTTSVLKAKFRSSKIWKEFRKKKMLEQKGKDPITGRKLYGGWNLHHKILTSDVDIYRDLSDSGNFIGLNKATHDAVHFGLDLIKHNGINAFDRYYEEVLREAVLNGYMTELNK